MTHDYVSMYTSYDGKHTLRAAAKQADRAGLTLRVCIMCGAIRTARWHENVTDDSPCAEPPPKGSYVYRVSRRRREMIVEAGEVVTKTGLVRFPSDRTRVTYSAVHHYLSEAEAAADVHAERVEDAKTCVRLAVDRVQRTKHEIARWTTAQAEAQQALADAEAALWALEAGDGA